MAQSEIVYLLEKEGQHERALYYQGLAQAQGIGDLHFDQNLEYNEDRTRRAFALNHVLQKRED